MSYDDDQTDGTAGETRKGLRPSLFKPGMVVRMLCGGPAMTVSATVSDGTVKCLWFTEDGEFRHAEFPVCVLEELPADFIP